MPQKHRKLDARKLNPRTKRAEFSIFDDPQIEEELATAFYTEEGEEDAKFREGNFEQNDDVNRRDILEKKQQSGQELTEEEEAFL